MPWCIFGWNVDGARPFRPVHGSWLGLCLQSDIAEKCLIVRRQRLAVIAMVQGILLLAGQIPSILDSGFSHVEKVFDLVHLVLWIPLFLSCMLNILVKEPEWNRVSMYAIFALVPLQVSTVFMSSYGLLHCGVLAAASPTLRVGFVGMSVAMPPLLQATSLGQLSFAMLALHVIVISLGLLGAYVCRAFQKVTDCPVPRSNSLSDYATPEICIAVFSNMTAFVGVVCISAKLKSSLFARSTHSQVIPQGDPQVSQDATNVGKPATIDSNRAEVAKAGPQVPKDEQPQLLEVAVPVNGLPRIFRPEDHGGTRDTGWARNDVCHVSPGTSNKIQSGPEFSSFPHALRTREPEEQHVTRNIAQNSDADLGAISVASFAVVPGHPQLSFNPNAYSVDPPSVHMIHDCQSMQRSSSRCRRSVRRSVSCNFRNLAGELLLSQSFNEDLHIGTVLRHVSEELGLNPYTSRLLSGTSLRSCRSQRDLGTAGDASGCAEFIILTDQDEIRSDEGSTGAVIHGAFEDDDITSNHSRNTFTSRNTLA